FPKGLVQKFMPKYIGPYKILKDYHNNSFLIELPSCLKQQGVHPVFHSLYLQIHHPNNNCLFPGCLDNQIAEFEDKEHEWSVKKITSHKGGHTNTVFEIKWKLGDVTWLLYNPVEHLDVLHEYFDTISHNHLRLTR
ncbi:hypothetical protein HYDPIDRAFT_101527, partial [Hydnomerulius pinastri MD-312]